MKIMSSSFMICSLFFFLSVVSAHQELENVFQNLTGCRLGDTNPAIIHLKEYLHHFGYLPTYSQHHHTNSFDDELLSALRTYQLNFDLKVTGVLDPPTIELLTTPRCGVPDIINGTNSMLMSGLNYSYFSKKQRWPSSKRELSVGVIYIEGADMDFNTVARALEAALDSWEKVTGFTFVGASSRPDIAIGFYKSIIDHGDGYPFKGGVLAHAFAPSDGRMHFNSDIDWYWAAESRTTGYAFDLESVALHEIGHLLGMGHSALKDAVMYPSIGARTRKVTLSKDDILGIRNLYDLKEQQPDQLHVAY